MRRIAIPVAACLFAFVATNTLADKTHNRYRWKDAQGSLHFDDALPAEALQFGYDVVNDKGMVVKHVPPPKTAEELKADAAAEAQKTAADKAAAEKARDDAQMLAAYPSEHDLTDAQNAQLAMIDQYIQATQLSLGTQEKSLTENLSHAADLERTGKPVPPALRQQIEDLRANIEKQKAYIAAKQQEKIDDSKKFDEELAHYRQVHGAKPAQP